MYGGDFHAGGINTIGYKVGGIILYLVMLVTGVISMKGWGFFLTLPMAIFAVAPFLDRPGEPYNPKHIPRDWYEKQIQESNGDKIT